MASRTTTMFVSIFVWIFVAIIATQGLSQELPIGEGKNTIYLSPVSPQAILRLPDRNVFDYSDGGVPCHWVDFGYVSKERERYGISVLVRNYQGEANGRLEISAYRSSEDDTSPPDKVETYVRSGSEFAVVNRKVCIKVIGERTETELLVTQYYNNSRRLSKNRECPERMSLCRCRSSSSTLSDLLAEVSDRHDDSDSDEDNRHNDYSRCISNDLTCNGAQNCGSDCFDDEKNCEAYPNFGDYYQSCLWTDTEYLLIMVMSGLLFVLIPVSFVAILVYHRKLASARRQLQSNDRNNNAQRDPRVHHVISTVPLHIDQPPAYDELPEAVKIRPVQQQNSSPA